MSWFSGKDDARFEAIDNVQHRAEKRGDHDKAERMCKKRDELLDNGGDVSKKTLGRWW